MFKIELINNTIFKDALESVSKIVDEVKIEIDSEGFRVNALDRSHIVFVGLNLESSLFDEYQCDTPDSIHVDTEELNRILKRCKKTDVLILEKNNENDLIIIFNGDTERTFKIKLIDAVYETRNPPSINPPNSIKIESNLLKDSLNDMELFGDVVDYSIDEEYFISECNGEFGDSDFKYLHGEMINETVKSSFSIDKLKQILSASKFSPICEVMLGNDMPGIFNFELDTGDGQLHYLLAPRLETEE